ncbi:MAG: type II secretion system protein N [Rudaea sp.]|nr:type II secretion system protein N [Rudaea sp.]
MKLFRSLILIVVVLLVIAAVVAATCPAEYAYRLVADRLGAVKLSGISGSVWNGHAASAQVFGQELGALDWQLHAAPLLGGELLAHVDLNGGDVTAAGTVDRNVGGTISVRDATFHMPAHMAAPALDIPALDLLGEIDGKLARAQLHGAWVDDASGSLRWNHAAVSGAAQAQLGDLEATFSSAPDGSIAGVVHDLGGPLQVAGTFKVAAGSFDAEAKLAARDDNPQVMEALRYIGQAQADGTSLLIIHGGLLKLF